MNKIILTTEEELETLIRKVLAEFASTILPNHNSSILSTNKPFLTINEAADFLSLSKQTLYGKTSKREIPFYKVGKRLYFKEQELIELIAKGRKPTIKELVEEYEDRRMKKKRN